MAGDRKFNPPPVSPKFRKFAGRAQEFDRIDLSLPERTKADWPL
jgi:hypothetical protein